MLSLVVAMADNRVSGRNNQLPWHLPADLKHFKALTMGKPMIMGRKTFESLGRVLPGRPHIVISRNPGYRLPEGDCHLATDLSSAIGLAQSMGDEAVVIGGAEIYQQALDWVDLMYVTEVHLQVEGDAHFPEFDVSQWSEVARDDRQDKQLAFSFVTYRRNNTNNSETDYV